MSARLHGVRDFRQLAVRNNAEFCDAVARTHDLEPRFDDDVWTSDRRTPLLYPDAISLSDAASAAAILARVDTALGCSIKDSFASLDFAAHGFRVLFEARWIVRPAARVPEPALRWDGVTTPNDFSLWETAWRADDGPADVLRPALLETSAVVVAAACRDSQVVAGAIFNRSAEVVGISNVFAIGSGAADAWAGAVAFADARFPDTTLVSYESGSDLDDARRVGFEDAGPLRIWIN